MEEMEKEMIRKAIERNEGNISAIASQLGNYAGKCNYCIGFFAVSIFSTVS